MKSYRCPRCGMVGWATAQVCKSCGTGVHHAAQIDYFVPFVSDANHDTQSLRAAALKKIVVGVAVSLLFALIVCAIYASGYRLVGIGWYVLAIPPAWALVGLLEIVTGVPFNQLSQKWDELSGARRGAIGLGVVFAAFALMIVGSCLVAFLIVEFG